MIAPAMTTRKRQQTIVYRDLAHNRVEMDRRIDADSLKRLAEVGRIGGPVSASFRFFELDGRPCVEVSAKGEIELPCQWCDMPRKCMLDARFTALIAQDEAQAERWAVEVPDVVPVVAGEEFDAVLLVEDELILAVPGRVCVETKCEHRPEASYGEAAPEREKPLAGLAELLGKKE